MNTHTGRRTVYLLHRPRRFYDITRASEFGDVKMIFDDPFLAQKTELRELVPLMRNALRDIKEDDYLLLLGDSVLIGIACAIVSEQLNGRLRLLKWRQPRDEPGAYVALDVDLDA